MQRTMISTRLLMALAAMMILAATTIPVVSGLGNSGDRPVTLNGCPPSC
jgi:hypothetical protein